MSSIKEEINKESEMNRNDDFFNQQEAYYKLLNPTPSPIILTSNNNNNNNDNDNDKDVLYRTENVYGTNDIKERTCNIKRYEKVCLNCNENFTIILYNNNTNSIRKLCGKNGDLKLCYRCDIPNEEKKLKRKYNCISKLTEELSME